MIDMPNRSYPPLIDILLVDDDAGDVVLAKRALENGKIFNAMHVARDGVEALEFLQQTGRFADAPRPDLILLDLNMPRKDGREVLADIKQDPRFRSIPVVVLTTSDSELDVANMYDLHANCYVTKPVDLEQFTKIVKEIKQFWFSVVKLPPD
jgi:two-component system, chemotaxis family, response regulator Rcp1